MTGVTGAFSGKSPPPSPGGERNGTPLQHNGKQASKLSPRRLLGQEPRMLFRMVFDTRFQRS